MVYKYILPIITLCIVTTGYSAEQLLADTKKSTTSSVTATSCTTSVPSSSKELPQRILDIVHPGSRLLNGELGRFYATLRQLDTNDRKNHCIAWNYTLKTLSQKSLEKLSLEEFENFLKELNTKIVGKSTPGAGKIRTEITFVADYTKTDSNMDNIIKYLKSLPNGTKDVETLTNYLLKAGKHGTAEQAHKANAFTQNELDVWKKFSFIPPMPDELPTALKNFYEELLRRFTIQEDPVRLAAFIHCEINKLHLFADGNGRLSRLLMNYILLQNRLPLIAFDCDQEHAQEVKKSDTDFEGFIVYLRKKMLEQETLEREMIEPLQIDSNVIAIARVAFQQGIITKATYDVIRNSPKS